MWDAVLHAWHTLVATVARGRISGPPLRGRRALVQVQLLEGEASQNVEFLAPYGRSALPASGEVLMLSVGGARDHKVVIAIEDPARRIQDLGTGEFGDSDGASRIVYRATLLEISSTRPVRVQSDTAVAVLAPAITLGDIADTVRKLIDERFVAVFNSHTHGGGSGPSPTIAVDTHTTTKTKAS